MKMNYYIHYTRGRMRIQTPLLHEKPARAKELEDFLKKVVGIVSVETNPVTGSALFYFDEKKINCEQIICMLEKNHYFCLLKAETNDQVVEKTAEKVLGFAEKVVVDSLGEGPIEGE